MDYDFNGPLKRITLPPGMVVLDLIDLHSRWKDWVLLGNAGFAQAFSTIGGETSKVPLYLFQSNGWKLVPQSANHVLTVSQGILETDDASEPFVDPAGSYSIRINRESPGIAIGYSSSGSAGPSAESIAAAILAITGNSGGATVDVNSIASAVWQNATRTLTTDVANQVLTNINAVLPINPTAVQIAQAVRRELNAELERLDAAVSTRMLKNTVVNANMVATNGVTVVGSGTKIDPWRPA